MYGVLAQFNFDKPYKFNKYHTQAVANIASAQGISADYIRRKLALLLFLHLFHFGGAKPKILASINEVVKYDFKYNINDQRNVFFLFWVQLIFGDKTSGFNYNNVDVFKYLNIKDAEYFYLFLKAFEFFVNKNYKEANKILIEIPYNRNVYISTWARLVEIVINIKKGRLDVAEHFLMNEIRIITSNKNKVFTINSNAIVIVKCAEILSVKIPKNVLLLATKTNIASSFHKVLLKTLAH